VNRSQRRRRPRPPRAAQLRGWRLAGAVLTAAALGLVMILLKDLVLLHLH